MNQLPSELKTERIHEFASDRLPPTPTASLIKELDFQYHETTDTWAYLPQRLEVRSKPPVRFNDGDNIHMRRYYLHDFLPSYWSDYAATYDGAVYDDPDLLQRLQIPPTARAHLAR